MWITTVLLLGLMGSLSHSHTIDTVVVLMEENRSFDHYLGWMKRDRPDINGLTGKEYNPQNPSDPHSTKVYVSDNAVWVDSYDPDHSLGGTTVETMGSSKVIDPAPMNGFVFQNSPRGPGQMVMRGFTPDKVPILSTLANEFALFDEWFCSIPADTNPNRRFFHSATAGGSMNDADWDPVFNQTTIFDELTKLGKTWRIYHFDWSPSCMFTHLRTPEATKNFFPYEQFAKDAAAGNLPNYAFIEPRMFPNLHNGAANDQHPDHDVRQGEQLMKDTYEAIRAGAQWNNSLFIITYDEHGGYYDHVPIVQKGVPNPDGKVTPDFNFTRAGIRIPTVMISPWIEKGHLEHGPPASAKPQSTSIYEASSFSATMTKLFGTSFLTKRDRWAATFDHILTRTTPRTDCPMKLPKVPFGPGDTERELKKELANELNSLQLHMVQQLATCVYPKVSKSHSRDVIAKVGKMTQAEAGEYVTNHFQQFLENTKN